MENLILQPELYGNKRIAFRLMCEDGEPYGALTTNIVEATLDDDEVCIPSWNLPKPLLDSYLASGRFVDTGKTVPTGYVEAPVWRVTCPELLAAVARLRKSERPDSGLSRPMRPDELRVILDMVCKAGCDRVPLKVRNLGIPFYFAGYNGERVFLTHAETCLVSLFTFDDLEPVSQQTGQDIQELVISWMDSAEGVAAQELIDSAYMASQMGIPVPVKVRWRDSNNSRSGFLTLKTYGLEESGASWVCAVEAVAGNNVIYRYGLTRLATALHDGKTLTMALKPGTTY